MEDSPLVSIALCTYNGEKFLAAQLDTLIAQTYKNLEVIAVDDCSTDNTYEILKTYAAKYPWFRIYRNAQNLSFLKNFQVAVSYCKGDLIALCDQDDLWLPEKIEMQVNAIGDNMFIYHDSEFINEDGTLVNQRVSDILNLYRGDCPEVFLLHNCVSGHSMLIKKELLAHAGSFEGYYHDWWLAYVATNIGTIDFLPQCLVQYRQHNASDTDMLQKKEQEEYTALVAQEETIRKKTWLEHCANYAENKDPAFVKLLFKLYNERPGRFFTFELGRLMKAHINTLFFIQKKSPEYKLRKITKFMWGLKGRNFWYTYIRPNKQKVLNLNQL